MVSFEISFLKEKLYDSDRSSKKERRAGGGGVEGRPAKARLRNSNSIVTYGMKGFKDTLVTYRGRF